MITAYGAWTESEMRISHMDDKMSRKMKSEAVSLTLPDYDKISGVGYLYQKSVKETYPLHTHDFYEIFYIRHIAHIIL